MCSGEIQRHQAAVLVKLPAPAGRLNIFKSEQIRQGASLQGEKRIQSTNWFLAGVEQDGASNGDARRVLSGGGLGFAASHQRAAKAVAELARDEVMVAFAAG